MYALIATDMRLKTTPGGSLLGTKRSNAAGGVRHAEARALGRHRTESWSYKTARTAERQKCFEHMLRARSLRQLDQCAQVHGKPAERW